MKMKMKTKKMAEVESFVVLNVGERKRESIGLYVLLLYGMTLPDRKSLVVSISPIIDGLFADMSNLQCIDMCVLIQ